MYMDVDTHKMAHFRLRTDLLSVLFVLMFHITFVHCM